MDGVLDVAKLAIGGVALIPLIAGLVEFSRRLGVEGKGLLAEAFALGVVFVAVAGAIQEGVIPEAGLAWVRVVMWGLAGGVAGVATSGVYDLVKKMVGRGEGG